MNGELPPRRQPPSAGTPPGTGPGPRGAGDGSVTVVIQREQPPGTSNWLPAPATPFRPILRMHQPPAPAPSAPSASSASQELPEGRSAVSIGISIFLLLAGAILRFAVTWSPEHINLQIVGVIFMIAGGVGLIASTVLYFMKRRRS